MADSHSTVFKLPEFKTETFRQTLDQLHNRASSLFSLSLRWKDIDGPFDSILNVIKERAKELHSTLESVERKLEDVKSRESRLCERERAIEAREKDFGIIQRKEKDERKREIEEIERLRAEIRQKEEELGLLNISVNEKIREIEVKQKECEVSCDELREERIEERDLKHEEKRKELELKEEKFKDLEFKEKLIQEWADQVELEKDKYMKLCKEVELQQKQLEDNQAFAVIMDGKALQIYLNEHSGDNDSTRIIVSMVLACSSDPSMLVLDALQGFYPPCLKKGDKEFEEEVARRSCILLLEELMKMSPRIGSPVKKEARRIALEWFGKLRTNAQHHLEILGFLLLVASYGLGSAFDSDKLLSRLEIAANHCQAPALFRALGFAHKISDFIQTLIRKKKLIEAIRFIYEFEMVGQFQPVSLLNDFLRISKSATRQLRRKNKTLEGQVDASNKRLADVKYALRCIEECKIDYGPALKGLEQQVGFWKKEISKKVAAALGDQIQKLHDKQEKHLGPAVAAVDASAVVPVTESATSSATASTSVSATSTTTTQPQRLSGNKRPREDVSAGKISKVCPGANQDLDSVASVASIKISGKEILEGKAAAEGDKIQKLNDEKEKPSAAAVDAPAVVSVTAPAISSGNASTSASNITAQPQRLSGNKHSQTDVKADNILNQSHGVNQVTIDVSSKTNLPPESHGVTASLNPQPKIYSLSVNPSKEELKKLLDMCEKHQLEDPEIAAALRSARDAAKLVLDIMNVPVPFKRDDSKYLKVQIKSSSLLLLRQLRAVAPEINPEIREEAKKYALFWKKILAKKRKKSPLEVLCFLEFLASFNLGSIFNEDALLYLLESDYWRREAPDICEVLGLANKIPSFIQNRIKKEQHLEAVKYIYALNMVDEFPPVSVLKDYLRNASKKSGKRPIEAQIVDIKFEIKSLEDVIKCVTDYKITGLSPEKLKERIVQLEQEKEEKQHTVQAQVSILETRPASPTLLQSSSSGCNARPQQKHGHKPPTAHYSSDYHSKPYNGPELAMHQHPPQHPPFYYTSQSFHLPHQHHVFPAYPHDIGLNNYGAATVSPAYPWDALGNFRHNMPYHY